MNRSSEALQQFLREVERHLAIFPDSFSKQLAVEARGWQVSLPSATQRSEPDAAALRYLLDSTAPDGQWADQAVHNFVGAMLKQSPPPATQRGARNEHSASVHEVEAAMNALYGGDKDTLKRLKQFAEKAYTDRYCGLSDDSLKALRAYCEPWMLLRLYTLVEIGQISRLSLERVLPLSETPAGGTAKVPEWEEGK
jgi:hypothetical protein